MKINWKYVLGALLALLGFGSCRPIEQIIDDIGNDIAMYGQPTAHFRFIGDVTDTDGKAIPGIRVVIAPRANETYYNDTLYTDQAGHVEKDCLKYDWSDEMKNAKVTFEDVDGETNGSFKTKEMRHGEFEVRQTKKGDGAWFDGNFTVKADAVLEKEEQ